MVVIYRRTIMSTSHTTDSGLVDSTGTSSKRCLGRARQAQLHGLELRVAMQADIFLRKPLKQIVFGRHVPHSGRAKVLAGDCQLLRNTRAGTSTDLRGGVVRVEHSRRSPR